MVQKSPFQIDQFLAGETTLNQTIEQGCLDYLELEHQTAEEQFESHVSQNFQQRLRTGKSIVVQITDVKESEDGAKLNLTAKIDYTRFPYNEPEKVLSALRLKDSSDNSTGDFVTGIPANDRLEEMVQPGTHTLYKCPRLTIESINLSDSNEAKGEIELSALRYPSTGGKYLYQKPVPEHKPSPEPHHFSVNDIYILDPSPDDYVSESAYFVLKNGEYSTSCNIFNEILNGNFTNESDLFDADTLQQFLDWMSDSGQVLEPNPNQQAFVKSINDEITLLQGPPGTGKTSGALAPGILSRLLSHSADAPCRILVTGPSNKAINEVLEDTNELLQQHLKESDKLAETELVRLSSPPKNRTNAESEIIYTPLYDDEIEEEYIETIRKRLRQTADAPKHIVVFATPRRVWRLGKKTIPGFALQDSETDVDDFVAEDNHDPTQYNLFDVVVADEGSMMRTPEFLLASSFYDRGGNILISGDHRQLPPVQDHEWRSEFKPTAASLAPYLSILDYCRLLRGDRLAQLDDKHWDLIQIPNVCDIELRQLTQTYRCHQDIASFLENWIYKALDDIEYNSNIDDRIATPSTTNEAVSEALDPEHPLTVITYDEPIYQQSNRLEAMITTALLPAIDTSESIGIVTPHNAQKGLLNNAIKKHAPGVDIESIDIETVERFQGGERDIMILNATVSDPDFIDKESEFLLNLNRLNVAMSRMKKKLIVITSSAIFDHIPLDLDEYQHALLWKGLDAECGISAITQKPAWQDTIDELPLDGPALSNIPQSTNLEIYHQRD